MNAETNLRHQLFGAWCAPLFTLFTVVGWLWLAHFWAPAPADLAPAETHQWFTDTYRFGNLLGNLIFLTGCCFLCVWSVQFSLMLAKIEGPMPVWSIVQGVGGILIAVIVILNCSFWISAAYRPEASPDVVVALNDIAWLGFLLAWPVLSMQMIAAALVALNDRSARPLMPRALAWWSIAGAVLLITASGPAFTQSGPFAYHGLLGFYLPMVIWGAWLDVHAWYMRRALLREIEAVGVPHAVLPTELHRA